MYQLCFTDTAKKQYNSLNSKLKKQVDKGLDRITLNPNKGKPLRGSLKGIWSERVSTYRILYKIISREIRILVLLIEHRKSVYGD